MGECEGFCYREKLNILGESVKVSEYDLKAIKLRYWITLHNSENICRGFTRSLRRYSTYVDCIDTTKHFELSTILTKTET